MSSKKLNEEVVEKDSKVVSSLDRIADAMEEMLVLLKKAERENREIEDGQKESE